MQDSWAVYEKYAMGDDELAPLTLTGKSSYSFGGLAATMIDSLDTLWMLGMKEEFARSANGATPPKGSLSRVPHVMDGTSGYGFLAIS